ncbi:hypothetical protein LX32DRAFT_323790 [Colletotrichum zoysiae]|uniref:Secreted protein n=1 Tax=Colletotrichum zoysiae TaxID=1216348 RepID=A0AAD9HJU1_9PEZI|nr:hypothetical protein LX32DRAFT_323790 [Colletotrichum zoysiae]
MAGQGWTHHGSAMMRLMLSLSRARLAAHSSSRKPASSLGTAFEAFSSFLLRRPGSVSASYARADTDQGTSMTARASFCIVAVIQTEDCMSAYNRCRSNESCCSRLPRSTGFVLFKEHHAL